MELKEFSLEGEEWREYEFGPEGTDYRIIYRINSPRLLVYRKGGTTHRVVGPDGVVHCVPAPGYHGCILRWRNKEGLPPVEF